MLEFLHSEFFILAVLYVVGWAGAAIVLSPIFLDDELRPIWMAAVPQLILALVLFWAPWLYMCSMIQRSVVVETELSAQQVLDFQQQPHRVIVGDPVDGAYRVETVRNDWLNEEVPGTLISHSAPLLSISLPGEYPRVETEDGKTIYSPDFYVRAPDGAAVLAHRFRSPAHAVFFFCILAPAKIIVFFLFPLLFTIFALSRFNTVYGNEQLDSFLTNCLTVLFWSSWGLFFLSMIVPDRIPIYLWGWLVGPMWMANFFLIVVFGSSCGIHVRGLTVPTRPIASLVNRVAGDLLSAIFSIPIALRYAVAWLTRLSGFAMLLGGTMFREQLVRWDLLSTRSPFEQSVEFLAIFLISFGLILVGRFLGIPQHEPSRDLPIVTEFQARMSFGLRLFSVVAAASLIVVGFWLDQTVVCVLAAFLLSLSLNFVAGTLDGSGTFGTSRYLERDWRLIEESNLARIELMREIRLIEMTEYRRTQEELSQEGMRVFDLQPWLLGHDQKRFEQIRQLGTFEAGRRMRRAFGPARTYELLNQPLSRGDKETLNRRMTKAFGPLESDTWEPNTSELVSAVSLTEGVAISMLLAGLAVITGYDGTGFGNWGWSTLMIIGASFGVVISFGISIKVLTGDFDWRNDAHLESWRTSWRLDALKTIDGFWTRMYGVIFLVVWYFVFESWLFIPATVALVTNWFGSKVDKRGFFYHRRPRFFDENFTDEMYYPEAPVESDNEEQNEEVEPRVPSTSELIDHARVFLELIRQREGFETWCQRTEFLIEGLSGNDLFDKRDLEDDDDATALIQIYACQLSDIGLRQFRDLDGLAEISDRELSKRLKLVFTDEDERRADFWRNRLENSDSYPKEIKDPDLAALADDLKHSLFLFSDLRKWHDYLGTMLDDIELVLNERPDPDDYPLKDYAKLLRAISEFPREDIVGFAKQPQEEVKTELADVFRDIVDEDSEPAQTPGPDRQHHNGDPKRGLLEEAAVEPPSDIWIPSKPLRQGSAIALARSLGINFDLLRVLCNDLQIDNVTTWFSPLSDEDQQKVRDKVSELDSDEFKPGHAYFLTLSDELDDQQIDDRIATLQRDEESLSESVSDRFDIAGVNDQKRRSLESQLLYVKWQIDFWQREQRRRSQQH